MIRRSVTVCGAAGLLLLLSVAASAVVDVSGAVRGIAVAPFVADGRDALVPDLASLLAARLSSLSSARVVSPGALRRDRRGADDPQARDIRRWARWNAVENVIVGRASTKRGPLTVEVELRSGHSGASRSVYRLVPQDESDLGDVVTQLAVLILADLGEGADTATDVLPSVSTAGPAPDSGPDRVPPSTGIEASPSESDTENAERGLTLLPGVSRDDPISINSDELEVLPEGGGRRLVFSRNVEVQQGDITLNADRLEAVYPQGASQPELLLASGRVRIVQGDRQGRCAEATYRRSSHMIVCRGKAEVIQGCDQVRGEEIQFDLERERVHVIGAASVVIQPKDAKTRGCATPATVGEGVR